MSIQCVCACKNSEACQRCSSVGLHLSLRGISINSCLSYHRPLCPMSILLSCFHIKYYNLPPSEGCYYCEEGSAVAPAGGRSRTQ